MNKSKLYQFFDQKLKPNIYGFLKTTDLSTRNKNLRLGITVFFIYLLFTSVSAIMGNSNAEKNLSNYKTALIERNSYVTDPIIQNCKFDPSIAQNTFINNCLNSAYKKAQFTTQTTISSNRRSLFFNFIYLILGLGGYIYVQNLSKKLKTGELE